MKSLWRKLEFCGGNAISLLQSGTQYFPALLEQIDQAQHEIYLETYIFSTDETGIAVREALIRAARRGVAVQIMLDWVGTGHRRSLQLQEVFTAAGVACRIFNPWFKRGFSRTHRKLCACDGEAAFIGGINIQSDTLADIDEETRLDHPRWDFALALTGAMAKRIHLELASAWSQLGRLAIRERMQILLERSLPASRPAMLEPVHAALVVRDNFRNRATIQKAYLQALGNARRYAWIANPYFAPGRKFRSALINAANRGVEVVLLLGVGHYRLQDAVARSFYPKLLCHGIRIVEYRKTELHAKVAVIDDHWATVGSSNVDGLSLFVNREANAVIRDPGFARQLREHIANGISQGVSVDLADYAGRPLRQRIWDGFAFLVYRSILRVVTFGMYS